MNSKRLTGALAWGALALLVAVPATDVLLSRGGTDGGNTPDTAGMISVAPLPDETAVPQETEVGALESTAPAPAGDVEPLSEPLIAKVEDEEPRVIDRAPRQAGVSGNNGAGLDILIPEPAENEEAVASTSTEPVLLPAYELPDFTGIDLEGIDIGDPVQLGPDTPSEDSTATVQQVDPDAERFSATSRPGLTDPGLNGIPQHVVGDEEFVVEGATHPVPPEDLLLDDLDPPDHTFVSDDASQSEFYRKWLINQQLQNNGGANPPRRGSGIRLDLLQ